MIATIIIGTCFCLAFFIVERIFTRSRTVSDYVMIWFLVIAGMMIQAVYGEEDPLVSTRNKCEAEREFVVE